ncbi:MAG: type II toxin-antitoxin system RelE/ParE family toxin [Thermodesulfovibrionales bacterium]|nr:type II toxin-antitoxin system RelE/ParE family toxin [Nitrospinota bacterium]MDP3048183.1 type II toxin-antitoxin system RelE/ParE family toxin [Thermodesulfovibrionales bacterium]
MAYVIEFTHQAEEDLARLDKTIAQQIANKIDWLSQNIASIIPTPLKGQFKGKYKLRVGDWRIVYSFEHASHVITIYTVKHRSEVYKT